MDLGMTTLNFPAALGGPEDVEPARDAIASARRRILDIERQLAYFDLLDIAQGLDKPATRMSFEMGSHYNDEGYSPHVCMAVDYVDEDGEAARAESDEEYGGFDSEDGEMFEPLREWAENLSDEVQSALERVQIDLTNPRAAASAVMGERGFCAHEALVLERSAAQAASGKPAARL